MVKTVTIICLILALAAAAGYLLMEVGVMHVGLTATDTTGPEAPPGFDWIMFAGYLVGGLLILLKKRWLWITGAIINAVSIIGFYAMWAGRTDVLFSGPGLITKIAQILLEAGLIYLLVKTKPVKNEVKAK